MEPVTVGEWLITFLIAAIPIVGIIMVFVWAFGSDTKPSKKAFFQAQLIVLAIAIVLGLLFGLLGGLLG
ncbi:MAG: hypothetical protein AAF268_01525 [Cyanobacteria bacterium P01_A01_bin.3]